MVFSSSDHVDPVTFISEYELKHLDEKYLWYVQVCEVVCTW